MTPQERVINTSERTEGMVDASASYYQESKLFHAIQNTQALEYDRVHEADLDLALQLSPLTATWGLIYWETANGITPNPNGSYDLRRSLVISRMASDQNFGAPMVHQLAKNFGEEIRVTIDTLEALVTVVFQRGVPTFLEQFNDALENIIHAHLGTEYKFEYHIRAAIEIETAYKRYLYDLPKAGPTKKCGTLPNIAVYGRVYSADVSLSADAHHTENDYKKVGTYAVGPLPFVAIDGRIYDVSAQVDASLRTIDQHYAQTGATDSGTKPDTAVMGRIYPEAAALATESRTTEQPYTPTGTADSGTKPDAAVIGRVYPEAPTVTADSHDADNTYRRCNQIYSGGEPI